MKHTCVIRSLNTKNGDHGGGAKLMMRGRRDEAEPHATPTSGAVLAREMGRADSKVPDYVTFYTRPRAAAWPPATPASSAPATRPMELTTNNDAREHPPARRHHRPRPQGAGRPPRPARASSSPQGRQSATLEQPQRGVPARPRPHGEREAVRRRRRSRRRSATGTARRSSASRCWSPAGWSRPGVPFVRVGRAWWDSHGQNFETHQEMVPELDHVMATLIDDLKERGLLDDVMIVTLAEFGRTPAINASLGRDHFASAWSTTLTGCGVKGGAVYGKTDAKGNTVVDGEVGRGAACSPRSTRRWASTRTRTTTSARRPVPLVNPGAEPIKARAGVTTTAA